jgi:enterochelin esterase-like enzyme
MRSDSHSLKLGLRRHWASVSKGMTPGFPAVVASCFAWICLSVRGVSLEVPSPGVLGRVQSGVPQGEVVRRIFAESAVFPGTVRDYWVYVPKQYTGEQAANLVVFQDGAGAVKADGAMRVPVVLDNLIAGGLLPVTVGVFVNPGSVPAGKPGAVVRSNRSFEYDSLGGRYAKFLVEELLPEALSGLNVTTDPAGRLVAGVSSGGICAFTLGWERPDQFGLVFSGIGSFTDIRGGGVYPTEVRKTKGAPRKIRVWMQEGEADVNNLFGHWPLSNQELAGALRYAGYDYRFELTGGGHSGAAAGALLPQALVWLFRNDSR